MGIAITRRGLSVGLLVLPAFAGAVVAAETETDRWMRAESPRFIIHGEIDTSELRAFADQLESFDWTLRLMHGLDPDETPPRKLNVFIASNLAELRATDPHMGEGIRGYYSASVEDIFIISLREKVEVTKANKHPTAWGESFLFHEYTHHFMLQYFPYAYPPWLVEGYAEYFGTTTIDGPVIEVGKFNIERVEELRSYDWVPMDALLSKRLGDIKPEQRSTFYAQAWWLTHYMKDDPVRAKQLQAYMLAVGKGEESVAAWQAATGQTPPDLEKALRIALSGKVGHQKLTRVKPLPPASVVVTRLPHAANDLLLLDQRLKHGVSTQDGPGFVAEVRGKTRPYPTDRLAQNLLARTEIEFGDRTRGKAVAADQIARSPEDVEALELAAMACLDEADSTKGADAAHALALEAQPYLAKAYKLDPARYQTLWTYARCRKRLDAHYPSPNTQAALLSALDYAPQVKELRFEVVAALMLCERYDDAAAVLAPLINDPHVAAYSDKARKMLEEIRKAQAAALPGKAS